MWGWGQATEGQLGLGPEGADSNKPLPTELPDLAGVYVQKIANGLEHTMVLTSDELIYSMGSGEKGRLGHSDAEIFGEGGPEAQPTTDHRAQAAITRPRTSTM